jgi:lipopolysaccharide transport system ATP-binding protein
VSTVVIRAEGLSKRYRIGGRGQYVLLRDVLSRALAAPGRLTRRVAAAARHPSPEVWALRDVSFTVTAGEAVGIIGSNGAGKTTLLRLLSRITRPTSGYAEIRGRVGSVLEVGAGFHPELTGRENIRLNGALLGMKKREIDRKFDEIVTFSGIGKFIDTPAKQYSSGMYVRLAFAVIAHMETEVLLVDEVLAVGDAAFQKKCLGKMEDATRQGRTVLFVSHNMGAVQQLTKTSLLLHEGALVDIGPSADVVTRYLQSALGEAAHIYDVGGAPRPDPTLRREVEFLRLELTSHPSGLIPADAEIDLLMTVRGNDPVDRFRLGLTIFRIDGTPVGAAFGPETLSIERGEVATFCMTVNDLRLAPGRYYCALSVGRGSHLRTRHEFDTVENVFHFETMAPEGDEGTRGIWSRRWGSVRFPVPRVARITPP